MLRTVREAVNGRFGNAISTANIYSKYMDDTLFNHKMLEKYTKGENTYEGRMSCGIMTYILTPYLVHDMDGIELIDNCTILGYGRHREDHVYLTTNVEGEEIIIDPTWKQFLTDYRQDVDSDYNRKLFFELPPFFVGTYSELDTIVDSFIKIGSTHMKKDDVMFWWKGGKYAPFKNDVMECIDNSNLYEKKDINIRKMIDKIKDDLYL